MRLHKDFWQIMINKNHQFSFCKIACCIFWVVQKLVQTRICIYEFLQSSSKLCKTEMWFFRNISMYFLTTFFLLFYLLTFLFTGFQMDNYKLMCEIVLSFSNYLIFFLHQFFFSHQSLFLNMEIFLSSVLIDRVSARFEF